MRYLILSDLHSNLEALQAVLAATEGAYDQVVCCGDLVGYGPDPDPVVNWVRENVKEVVRGNHDKACSGITDAEDFSDLARIAAYWTRQHLNEENIQYLSSLPPGPLSIADSFAILHGSPRDEDEYLPTHWDASESFDLLTHSVSFFGHTHIQGGFVKSEDLLAARTVEVELPGLFMKAAVSGRDHAKLTVQEHKIYLLNPGSVGQPRDRDHRAAFAIFDTDGFVEYGRVPYDIEATMKKILDSGLPEFLAYRLSMGR